MKKILFCLLLLTGLVAQSQSYNNEWIDYSKTYYKFKLGKTGLYRIPQATLSAAGLGSASAESFQLWRNGVQVPVFTSVPSGALSGSDYLEFWGEMNDGKADKGLYRVPDYQLNDHWSLETDTASYFLTVNVSGNNLRLQTTANNVAGTSLSVEPYFNYTLGNYFKNRINAGEAVDVGQYLYSSSYDKGEGWTSDDIGAQGVLSIANNNLYVYTSGPDAQLKFNAFGNNPIEQRRVGVKINGTVIDTMLQMNYCTYVRASYPVPLSILSSNSANLDFLNLTSAANDRMVIAQYELTYPRQFNFGGTSNFEFSLPASAAGNNLQISNFSYGATAPVLYDITNGKRYVGDISTAGIVKVVLEPSAVTRRMVLVNEENNNVSSINSLQQRTFADYTKSANQADYMIVTNSLLLGGGTNPVESYRAYRSSAAGGNYNAKIYLIEDITDQFGFGIKKSPLALRNFILFARRTFAPKHVFFMGKGTNYIAQRAYESNTNIDKLNLVPTFGSPASDALLTADPGSSVAQLSFGRLSAINPTEVANYLSKVKEYELAQATLSPNRLDKDWMKNVVHLNGITETDLRPIIDGYFKKYHDIISDTLFGAKVTTFTKTSTDAVQVISSDYLTSLFKEGISLMTYFGHSSTNTLEFNLDNPNSYDNKGKYPLFIALGCQAGDFFNFNTNRFITDETISEKYVLAKDKGTIGFVASTHFGIPLYLDMWNTQFYKAIAATHYNQPIGQLMVETAKSVFNNLSYKEDFYARANMEELEYHGDPALKVNSHNKPDYVIDDQLVKISPDFISIAEPFIKIKAKFINIGKAINNTIVVQVKREYPDTRSEVVYRDTIQGIHYADSLSITLPIDALHDKGTNKITITVDADNNVDEIFETNNSVTKEIVIYEDELKPLYPQNFAIINKQNIKFFASTADPFSSSKEYKMEIDTTEMFNSPFKVSRSLTSKGGVLEFDPGVVFTDSTVYYWRVAKVPTTGNYNWNTSSFIYLPSYKVGFNQSHLYQFQKSEYNGINYSNTGVYSFTDKINNIFVRNGVFPTAANYAVDFSVSVNSDNSYIRSVCGISNIIVNVFDPVTFKPWFNAEAGQQGQYGSDYVCGNERKYNFQYNILDVNKRKSLIDFLDMIPSNYYILVRNTSGTDFSSNTYSDDWKKDTTTFGSNNSIYHRLYGQGFSAIDSFNRPRAWIFVYKKYDSTSFKPRYTFSDGIYDKITLSVDQTTPNTFGTMVSPLFGPAKQWDKLIWNGSSKETQSTDVVGVDVIGVRTDGNETVLYDNLGLDKQNFDISAIDAKKYPYVKLKLNSLDTVNLTPYQLRYWRLTYTPVPEGALAPNIYLNFKDTVAVGEPLDIKIAFKNISETPFDSLKVKMVLTDANNVQYVLPVLKHRPLAANDTLHIKYNLDTRQYAGLNNLYVEVNPDNDQIEQYHFNNFAYKNFYVTSDSLNPLLDVTFDNVHILNNDIVSSKPEILIKLKDESTFGLLDDTSLIKVQVAYPTGSVRTFYFNSDTLRFTRASKASDNTATVNFKPYFEEDGIYTLTVTGKDKTGNKSSASGYKVSYEVINKAMISNLLNYPNPFTTSTAFVFTLTGSDIPQEFKIQVLTVTGKVVREITKDELGPIRIGRNITEFKWDGTDQYGQKVANGVYLYRVVTGLNGKTLEKYKSENDNTDKYFNKGYGKMYLMR